MVCARVKSMLQRVSQVLEGAIGELTRRSLGPGGAEGATEGEARPGVTVGGELLEEMAAAVTDMKEEVRAAAEVVDQCATEARA